MKDQQNNQPTNQQGMNETKKNYNNMKSMQLSFLFSIFFNHFYDNLWQLSSSTQLILQTSYIYVSVTIISISYTMWQVELNSPLPPSSSVLLFHPHHLPPISITLSEFSNNNQKKNLSHEISNWSIHLFNNNYTWTGWWYWFPMSYFIIFLIKKKILRQMFMMKWQDIQ